MSRRERQKRRERHRGHPIRRVGMMSVGLALIGVVIAALAAVGWVVAVAASAPNLKQLKPRDPHSLSEIFAADGTLLGYIHSDTVFSHVAADQIPTRLKEATVAIEDRRFFHHGALDYQGILRAGIKDVFGGGNSLQGASTLTMQLVNNKYILPGTVAVHHNLKYKIVQAKLAQQLEKLHNKNWILDSYLNYVPYGTVYGETAIGVGAASQVFFNKPVWKLNLAQEALLAGLPQAPSEFNPFLAPGFAKRRRNEVLQAMVSSHYISPGLAAAVSRQPLQIHVNDTYSTRREPYVFDYVERQLDQQLCPQTPTYCPKVSNGGLKIYTTIDLNMQFLARAAILSHEGGPGQPAAALATVDPSDGHILAMASSASYDQTKFDYPVQAHRQPGSSFKVFVLMTLIHDFHGDPGQTHYTSQFLPAGWLPGYPAYEVHTAEQSYQGDINITKATAVSDNTVFAQLDVDLGPDKVRDTAYAMGITSHLDGIPAEAIGGLKYGVTPLEMADAYATLANGGSHVPATIVNKVVFPTGQVEDFGNPSHTPVFTDGEAYAATNVLKGVITGGTGTAADYGCPAAGKTGTANNLENAWFVGYTPKLSTAVWVGYPGGNIPMANGFGGALAAPIWHDFMVKASGGYCGDFSQPTNPFQGTAYVGAHASSGASSNGSGTTTGTGTSTTPSGRTGVTSTNSYTNPTLYSHPPQPPANKHSGPTSHAPPAGHGGGNGHSGSGGAGVRH